MLKCRSCLALVISLVLILKSSINSLEFDSIVKLFCQISEEVPGISSSQGFVRDLFQDCCIFLKFLNNMFLAKLLHTEGAFHIGHFSQPQGLLHKYIHPFWSFSSYRYGGCFTNPLYSGGLAKPIY